MSQHNQQQTDRIDKHQRSQTNDPVLADGDIPTGCSRIGIGEMKGIDGLAVGKEPEEKPMDEFMQYETQSDKNDQNKKRTDR